MKSAIVTVLLLASSLPVPAGAIPVELGAMVGAGPCFTFGSYLDAKAATLADLGTVSGVPGTSVYRLFPGMVAGGYGQIGLLRWLDLRVELRLSYLGASRLALNGAGQAFDAYGAGLYALMLPILGQVSFALGPGRATLTLGPYYGLVLGGVRIQDTYAATTTDAQVSLTFGQASMLGISGGAGYRFRLGGGIASAELRADWTLLPVRLDTGLGLGDLAPLNIALVLGYGFTLGSSN